jgi:hypothetical protein
MYPWYLVQLGARRAPHHGDLRPLSLHFLHHLQAQATVAPGNQHTSSLQKGAVVDCEEEWVIFDNYW